MKNLRINVKEERGSSSALALVTVLTFAAILAGIFAVVMTRAQGQIKSDIRIQEIYGNEVERADEIYNEIVENVIAERMYLYKNNNEYTDLTGGWKAGSNSYTKTLLANGNMQITRNGSWSEVYTTNKIDLEDYNYMVVNVTNLSGATLYRGYITEDEKTEPSLKDIQLTNGKNRIDIKDYDSSYYIGFSPVGEVTGNMEIVELYLEKN